MPSFTSPFTATSNRPNLLARKRKTRLACNERKDNHHIGLEII
jgi:hypothetical protein